MKGKLGTLKITAKEDESVEETGPDGQRLRETGRWFQQETQKLQVRTRTSQPREKAVGPFAWAKLGSDRVKDGDRDGGQRGACGGVGGDQDQ